MVPVPPAPVRVARTRCRWLPPAAAVVCGLGVAAAIGWSALWQALPNLLAAELGRALDDDPLWEGHLSHLTLDPWHATGTFRDLELRATTDRKVLRRIEIPRGTLRWTWSSLLRGALHVDLVALQPTVEARARRSRLPPPDPPPPDPGWFRFELDTAIVDGTWVWRDLEREPAAHVVLSPVDGSYDHIGTVDGPGRLSLVAHLPDDGWVDVAAQLDFWNADRNAYDLTLGLHQLTPASLQGAEETYGDAPRGRPVRRPLRRYLGPGPAGARARTVRGGHPRRPASGTDPPHPRGAGSSPTIRPCSGSPSATSS
ncbi:MAG: hypothetical protein R3F59_23425 [Myxococcota bacterium]